MGETDLLTWNSIVAHLATFRDILSRDTSAQSLFMMSWRLDCSMEETKQDSPAVMSSTYFHLLEAEEATRLTIARNTMGPTLVPCGTPQVGDVQAETVASIFTHCRLSDRKSPTQLSRAGRKFMNRSFSITTDIQRVKGLAVAYHQQVDVPAQLHLTEHKMHKVILARKCVIERPCDCQTAWCLVTGSCPASSISWQLTHTLWQGCK